MHKHSNPNGAEVNPLHMGGEQAGACPQSLGGITAWLSSGCPLERYQI